MDEACYICRRTQVDLDRLNEELRTKVYLSYFSNTRGQIDEQRRKINFLQRLKDEESGDPHFRINAKQVFDDPPAYKKLMPWIDTLMEIASANEKVKDSKDTMGELVNKLLAEERGDIAKLDEALNQLRTGFATGAKHPLSLEVVNVAFPVNWKIDNASLRWHVSRPDERPPLRQEPGDPSLSVEIQIHLCSVCQKLCSKLQ
jgi:hypothetical protein